LIKRILELSTDKNSTVLDIFAGSGTTGHAVLELNREDGGYRNFILCTNNENEICNEVCYPRVKKVIGGYKNQKGEKIEGLGGNLKYYKTDFVEADPTDKNKRKLVKESTDMLCILENAFELIQETPEFKIFKNTDKYVGVIFYEEAIDDYKKAIKKIDGHFNTYVFSMNDDPHTKTFVDIKSKVTLCAIPDVILKVYREIFK
jgi:adenine-specific DNA-methyltransferase